MYTVKSIKEALPNVTVRIGERETVTATVSGRRLDYARVRLPDGRVYDFAWETVAHSLNTDTPLLV